MLITNAHLLLFFVQLLWEMFHTYVTPTANKGDVICALTACSRESKAQTGHSRHAHTDDEARRDYRQAAPLIWDTNQYPPSIRCPWRLLTDPSNLCTSPLQPLHQLWGKMPWGGGGRGRERGRGGKSRRGWKGGKGEGRRGGARWWRGGGRRWRRGGGGRTEPNKLNWSFLFACVWAWKIRSQEMIKGAAWTLNNPRATKCMWLYGNVAFFFSSSSLISSSVCQRKRGEREWVEQDAHSQKETSVHSRQTV